MNGAAANPVEYADMQGLLRFSHAHLAGCRLLLLRVREPRQARRWLARVPVLSAEKSPRLPRHAVQLALTAAGLTALGLPADVLAAFPEPFLGGVAGDANRSRRLGDTGANAPQHWRWGGAGPEAHLLLMLYAAPGDLDTWENEVVGEGFDTAFEVLHRPPDSRMSRTEPFGFADGVSQPVVDWGQSLKLEVGGRADFRHDMALGELALGYRNEYGLFCDRPLLDPRRYPGADELAPAVDAPGLHDLGRNGSYLVVRQLAQDVAGFWRYLEQQAGGDDAGAESLACALVGRRRDGAPLLPGGRPAPGGINDFDYDDDPLGRACPLAAHVRRANPRSGDFPPRADGPLSRLRATLGFGRRHRGEDLVASTRFHRLVRRGRVYGEAPDTGLHFMCLGADIARQFEFVQAAWMASATFAGLQGQADPLLGSREPQLGGQPTDNFHDTRPGAEPARLTGLPRFVTLRGAGYFFLPGIRALRFIAGCGESGNGA
ncbi:Dyp-type peroxidase [Parahaliea mediterranea]|uniref:Peroxidase n=1 Tax=Parahaliea mediterranea TaxID=651086 RepID=A0A939ILH3_9GAMM|nr:hypothetical protein [Parahaliea mediterranea]MBN7795978.1 hypothetical protein [Parahaliea mediterranea]